MYFQGHINFMDVKKDLIIKILKDTALFIIVKN